MKTIFLNPLYFEDDVLNYITIRIENQVHIHKNRHSKIYRLTILDLWGNSMYSSKVNQDRQHRLQNNNHDCQAH